MGKDKSDKKDKKEKSSAGISKKDHKREKKEKKDKLAKALTDPTTGDVSDKFLQEIEKQQVVHGGEKVVKKEKKKDRKDKKGKDAEGDVEMDRAEIVVPVVQKNSKEEKGAAVGGEDEGGEPENVVNDKTAVVEGGEILVPFAKPLANEKVTKKALKTIKKGAKSKCLKRGVKEVVKSIRKSPSSSTTSAPPHGVVVLAADISPMDVISHIPVLCEDHNIPYVFVHSRAELGLAGGTKRPTSVVMIVPTLVRGKKPGKESKKEDEEGLKEAYDELVKAVKALQ